MMSNSRTSRAAICAAALAALLRNPPRGACVGVILSGGNVEPELLSNAVTRHATI